MISLCRARHIRKNWLLAGHDEAGRSHATLYTLIAGVQRDGIDPHAHLRSVLTRIATTPMSEPGQFLPEKWKAADHAEPPSEPASGNF